MKRDSLAERLAAFGFVLVVFPGVDAVAQTSESPYTSMQVREIKALSAEQIESYRKGQGMGFALAAELNGYPGPKHVLELQEELELTQDQRQRTEEIFAEMNRTAEGLGAEIVRLEQELDQLFVSHTINDQSLGERTGDIAVLQGRLRAAHLSAHLEMMNVLSEKQVHQYIQLRGYQGDGHQGHHPGMSHGESE